jgi:hypothetical protein
MTAKGCNQFATPQRNLSLCSALGVAVLSTSFLLTVEVNKTHAEIIDSVTEDINQARVREFRGSKGGAACNRLENVTTFMGNTAHPVRAGRYAFLHSLERCGERSELAMRRTEIGRTYWYGWSIFIPSDWQDTNPGFDIVQQFATFPTRRGRRFPCGGNGSKISRRGNSLILDFQRQGNSVDVECTSYPLVRVSEIRGQWADFVMHVKWTGNTDGFLRIWTKVGNDSYVQRLDYTGRTFWNDEGDGPYFKMGLYKGDPNWDGPAPRTVYTDEYRLGDDRSSFEEVAPR